MFCIEISIVYNYNKLLYLCRYIADIKNNTDLIVKNLQLLWLHSTDAQIYIASLWMGACTVVQLADDLKLNRVTTHDAIQRLIKRWLFLETYSGQHRLVYPKRVEALQSLVDFKKFELTQIQYQVDLTISLLHNIQLQSDHLPHVRFYKGKEGIQKISNEMLHDNKPISILSDSRHFDDLIDNKFIEQSWTSPHYHEKIKLIIPIGYEHFIFTHKAKHPHVNIQQFSSWQWWAGGMSVRWNKIAYYSYEGRYITTTVIENAPISQLMMFSFQSLRSQSLQ